MYNVGGLSANRCQLSNGLERGTEHAQYMLLCTVYAAMHSICCYAQYMLLCTVYAAMHSICCYAQYMLLCTVYAAMHSICCYAQ